MSVLILPFNRFLISCPIKTYDQPVKRTFFSIILLGILWPLVAQNPTFPPRDETILDPSLQTFTNQLIKWIDDRDIHSLTKVMDIQVHGTISGDGGLDEFLNTWDLRDKNNVSWLLLRRVIEMGGVYLNDTLDETGRYHFVFPYVYDIPLDIEDDFYNIGVITGAKVNVRIGPGTSNPVKTQLDYDVVWFVTDDLAGQTTMGKNPFGDPEWYLVETYNHDVRGWVNWQYVYSPTWYRLFLYKDTKGEWKISAFLAGD